MIRVIIFIFVNCQWICHTMLHSWLDFEDDWGYRLLFTDLSFHLIYFFPTPNNIYVLYGSVGQDMMLYWLLKTITIWQRLINIFRESFLEVVKRNGRIFCWSLNLLRTTDAQRLVVELRQHVLYFRCKVVIIYTLLCFLNKNPFLHFAMISFALSFILPVIHLLK